MDKKILAVNFGGLGDEILFLPVKLARIKYRGGYCERSISIMPVGMCMCISFLESKLARYYKKI